VAVQPHVLTPSGLGGALGPAQQRQPHTLASVVTVRRQPMNVDRVPRRLAPGLNILPLQRDLPSALAPPARNPRLAAHHRLGEDVAQGTWRTATRTPNRIAPCAGAAVDLEERIQVRRTGKRYGQVRRFGPRPPEPLLVEVDRIVGADGAAVGEARAAVVVVEQLVPGDAVQSQPGLTGGDARPL